MSSMMKYINPWGEEVTEAEFVEQAEAMPDAEKFFERGMDYNRAAMKYCMTHGSTLLRKEFHKLMAEKLRTLSPESLVEMGRLGAEFDALWYASN